MGAGEPSPSPLPGRRGEYEILDTRLTCGRFLPEGVVLIPPLLEPVIVPPVSGAVLGGEASGLPMGVLLDPREGGERGLVLGSRRRERGRRRGFPPDEEAEGAGDLEFGEEEEEECWECRSAGRAPNVREGAPTSEFIVVA
jgi:hypothetical protein